MVAAAGDVDVVVDLATKDEARLTTTTTTTISVGPPPRERIERRAAERISQPAWCEPRPRSRHDLFLSVSVACGRGTSALSFPFFFPSLLCERGPRKGRISSSRDLSLI